MIRVKTMLVPGTNLHIELYPDNTVKIFENCGFIGFGAWVEPMKKLALSKSLDIPEDAPRLLTDEEILLVQNFLASQ